MIGTAHLLVGATITVGVHPTFKLFGLTFDADTIWATGVSTLLVLYLGLKLRREATSGVPGRLQAAFEALVNWVTNQVDGTIGPAGKSVIPLAVTLFVFILCANILTVFGLGAYYEWLPPPTADIALPLSLAVFVIAGVHIYSLRARGIVGYLKHYFIHPFPIYLFPFNLFINLVEEIVKPVTLTLRLFGNLLSGGLMLALLAALGGWKIGAVPIGNVFEIITIPIWKIFDLAIGGIQAFLFALLTMLYFDVAMTVDQGHTEEQKLFHLDEAAEV